MQHQGKIRYSRHLIMPEIGEIGQQKLLNSKILVIGAGGLGSPALLYLAASGVGNIIIADNDRLEVSNLQRQIIHETSDIGRNKAESARDGILDLNPDIKVDVFTQKVDETNLDELLQKVDLVVDGSDNFETRFLVNDFAIKHKTPLISAAILRFEGQIALFRPWAAAQNPCYRCLYPDIPPEGTMPNCSTNGIFSPVAGVMGCLQAVMAVKLLAGIDDNLDQYLMIFDAKKMAFRKVKLQRDKGCKCNN